MKKYHTIGEVTKAYAQAVKAEAEAKADRKRLMLILLEHLPYNKDMKGGETKTLQVGDIHLTIKPHIYLKVQGCDVEDLPEALVKKDFDHEAWLSLTEEERKTIAKNNPHKFFVVGNKVFAVMVD